jgi:hypothetical protein
MPTTIRSRYGALESSAIAIAIAAIAGFVHWVRRMGPSKSSARVGPVRSELRDRANKLSTDPDFRSWADSIREEAAKGRVNGPMLGKAELKTRRAGTQS